MASIFQPGPSADRQQTRDGQQESLFHSDEDDHLSRIRDNPPTLPFWNEESVAADSGRSTGLPSRDRVQEGS
jgi:hypothetical protein